MIDKSFISKCFTADHWATSHGAELGTHRIGSGMLYYAIVHMIQAKVCVCLGSGGGLVPSIMRQAQRDLGIEESKTVIVDANTGNWGRPVWIAPGSFFRRTWPEIEWWECTTNDAVSRVDFKIDYLHIDADHSKAWDDFVNWRELVRVGGFITLHDTNLKGGVCKAPHAVELIRAAEDLDIVDIPDIGAGVAIARRRK